MAIPRTFQRQAMASGFTQEGTYGGGIGGFAPAEWFGLIDFPESANEQWDDLTENNATLVSQTEFATHQEIVRQSVRFAYQEDRAKVNTLAWLLGMTFGNAVEDVQDGVHNAYRHKFIPSSSTTLPSVNIQTKREDGAQYKYKGILAGGVVLQGNGPFWQIRSDLIGDGSREESTDPFVDPIAEPWCLWGDGSIFFLDTGGTPDDPAAPITLPTTPTQTGTDLGVSAVDVSRRIHTFTFSFNNNLQADLGYRPGTHRRRQKFYPSRRTATVEMEFDIDTTDDAANLALYLEQSQVAIEMNMYQTNINEVPVKIDPAGTFVYGAKLIIPRVQLSTPRFGTRGELDTLITTGTVMDDNLNPPVVVWVYNAQPAYLVTY